MNSHVSPTTATAPVAVALAQRNRSTGIEPGSSGNLADAAGVDTMFSLGVGINRVPVEPYQRKKDDPLYRPLRIYTIDPAAPRLDGAIGTINVPYEPLEPGPVGCLFEVDNRNGERGVDYRRADLDDRNVLIADGYAPSPSDPRFHQQMVYAVCSSVYDSFRTALGRDLSWGFGSKATAGKLVLRPHYGEQCNAYYMNDKTAGSLCFGYFPASERPTDRSMPGGYVFTCLSHDVVAHEVTHALLDGLRAQFSVPSSSDVVAFHEGFADLVAIFKHFSHREVLMAGIKRCRGALEKADVLNDLAQQFGHTTGRDRALRSAIETDAEHPAQYEPDLESHALGSILVNAVFDAFVQIFKRKTERYFRLASHGSGVLPPGELPHDLQSILAEKASRLAGQFLNICIRAIDYCPPVGLNFGDYLRAMITADCDVVPDDPWDYRGALIDAFWRRNIYPRSATSLSEDALLWRPPRMALPPASALAFGNLHFKGDPGQAVDANELRGQASALGRYVTQASCAAEFGLVRNGDPRLRGDRVEAPCVESIRTARRAGPDGRIVFDLVAEITQLRHVQASSDGPAFSYHGGSTVILGPTGEIRFAVLKNVIGEGRLERRRQFLESKIGSRYWAVVGRQYQPRDNIFRIAHESRVANESK